MLHELYCTAVAEDVKLIISFDRQIPADLTVMWSAVQFFTEKYAQRVISKLCKPSNEHTYPAHATADFTVFFEQSL